MNKQRILGIILQYMQMGLSILISLAYTPMMLNLLGKNEYGIYNLATSSISYLSLLSLGFGSSYLRFYSIYKRNNNKDGINKLNGLYLLVFFVMGTVALIGGLFLAKNAYIFYNESYTTKEINTAKVLMIFLSINLAESFPASVFVSYVTSQEKFVFQKLLNIGRTIVSPIVSVILLYFGYGSVGMVISTTIISFAVDAINIYYCFAKLNIGIDFRHPNFALLKDIFIFSIFIAINQIIDQINWQTDKVILGKMVNGGAVAVYAIGAQINTMFTSISVAVSGVFAPKVNMIVQENKKDCDNRLTDLFIKVGRIQWYIMALALTGFIFFGRYFIRIWAGEGYENAYWVALLLMAPAIVPLIQNIGIEIQMAKNKHQFRSIVYLMMAFINVGISIYFVSLWNEIGAAVGTTLSLIVANGLIMNIYYQRKLGINVILFWKSIVSTTKCLIFPIVFGCLILRFYNINNLVGFILIIIAYCGIYLTSCYLFGFNIEEREIINSIKKKVFS